MKITTAYKENQELVDTSVQDTPGQESAARALVACRRGPDSPNPPKRALADWLSPRGTAVPLVLAADWLTRAVLDRQSAAQAQLDFTRVRLLEQKPAKYKLSQRTDNQ